jgi:hypothetical protein
MKLHKGKWKANFRDTYSLQDTLSPIIGAALVKYKEVITEEGCMRKGLPVTWLRKCVDEGVVEWEDERCGIMSDESFDKCFNLWLAMLDDCIYAFTTEEPDISKYDFDFNQVFSEQGHLTRIECTNEDENERYNRDVDEHFERVSKGFKLFGENLQGFWW